MNWQGPARGVEGDQRLRAPIPQDWLHSGCHLISGNNVRNVILVAGLRAGGLQAPVPYSKDANGDDEKTCSCGTEQLMTS